MGWVGWDRMDRKGPEQVISGAERGLGVTGTCPLRTPTGATERQVGTRSCLHAVILREQAASLVLLPRQWGQGPAHSPAHRGCLCPVAQPKGQEIGHLVPLTQPTAQGTQPGPGVPRAPSPFPSPRSTLLLTQRGRVC